MLIARKKIISFQVNGNFTTDRGDIENSFNDFANRCIYQYQLGIVRSNQNKEAINLLFSKIPRHWTLVINLVYFST